MTSLFQYMDGDGDELIVRPSARIPGDTMFDVDPPDGVCRSVRVPRDQLERLYNALGAHLYPTRPQPTQDEWDRAMEGFRNMATGLAKAILPLSEAFKAAGFKPVANPEPVCGACGYANGGYCDECGYVDPEPRDVGHPVAPPKQLAGCPDCRHSWKFHGHGGCKVWNAGSCGCQRQPPKAAAPCHLSEPLMRPLSKRCGECGHPWGAHAEVLRKRAAKGLCTCTHPSEDHHAPAPGWEGGCLACTCEYVPDSGPKCVCGHVESNHRVSVRRPCVWTECACTEYRGTP